MIDEQDAFVIKVSIFNTMFLNSVTLDKSFILFKASDTSAVKRKLGRWVETKSHLREIVGYSLIK